MPFEGNRSVPAGVAAAELPEPAATAERMIRAVTRGRVLAEDFPELTSIDAGLRVQLAMLDARVEAGDRLTGWKVALTSGRSRDRMGGGIRPFAHLLESRTFRSGDTIELADGRSWAIEPELVFTLGGDLPGDAAPDDVELSIITVRPAFEILEYRTEPGTPHGVAVAENMAQWGIVLGPATSWEGTIADVSVSLDCGAQRVGDAGPGVLIDEPADSIASVARLLARHDRRVRAGHYLLTGSFLIRPIDGEGTWTADFGRFGAVAVTVARPPAERREG